MTPDQWKIVFDALNSGFVQTLRLFFATLLGAIPLGLVIMFGRRSRFKPLSGLVQGLSWIIRGSPLMIQLLVMYYGPGLVFNWHPWGGGEAGRYGAAVTAFVINYAFYFAEIYRGGIASIPAGQEEAGLVLGMTRPQIFFKVKLLQMVKAIMPPMSNEVITLVKDTSLSRIIALQEVVWAGQKFLKGSNGIRANILPLLFTGVYYLVFNGLLTVLLGRIEKRLSYFR